MNTTPIHAAITELKNALSHVTKHVPPEIQAEHWQLSKHSPGAWAALAEKYRDDQRVAACAALVAALGSLQATVSALEAEGRPLRPLAKARPWH